MDGWFRQTAFRRMPLSTFARSMCARPAENSFSFLQRLVVGSKGNDGPIEFSADDWTRNISSASVHNRIDTPISEGTNGYKGKRWTRRAQPAMPDLALKPFETTRYCSELCAYAIAQPARCPKSRRAWLKAQRESNQQRPILQKEEYTNLV